MDARELNNTMNYYGMEKCARKILFEDKLVTINEIAFMTSLEVCSMLLDYYEVVSCEGDDIAIVKHENMPTYDSIVKHLSR